MFKFIYFLKIVFINNCIYNFIDTPYFNKQLPLTDGYPNPTASLITVL